MTIRNYALCKNGDTPQDWEFNQDEQKPRYGRLLFIKNDQVLLMQKPGKPWKLPGLLLDHSDQETELSEWARDFLGLSIDQFEQPLGLYTVGVRYANEAKYRYREALIHIPMMWREGSPRRSRLFDILWQPVDSLMRNTSLATRDYLKEFREQSSDRVMAYDFAQAS